MREKSGRKQGGQVGHPGTTLEFVERPDRLVIHAPQSCFLCGSSLAGIKAASTERRQVHDLPPPEIEVTEYQVPTSICGRCGMQNKGEFPAGVKAPAQYGAGVKSVAAYLFPNDEAVFKLMYLALRNISKRWTMPILNWSAALNQFAILLEGESRWADYLSFVQSSAAVRL